MAGSAAGQDSVDKFNTTMGKGFWTTIEMWQVCAVTFWLACCHRDKEMRKGSWCRVAMRQRV